MLNWFDKFGRHDLPWQQDINPYRVWISEIMLQQTQVKTVIPYFERFMAAFPTLGALAAAPVDQVLHLWTGLGYYARARNLHKTAQLVDNEYAGDLPDTVAALETLPGIGRSTAGAICAIAFNRRATILDGNVKRVLARYHTIEGWPGHSVVQKQLWQIAETYTPTNRCADYTQAIMDLGATLCTRSKPDCQACPLNNGCLAHAGAISEQFPTKKPRKKLPVRSSYFLVISDSDKRTLLLQRPPQGLWGGLWCFPQCESKVAIGETCERLGIQISASSDTLAETQYARQTLRQSTRENQASKYGPGNSLVQDYRFGKSQRHTFSHFHLDYTPVYIALSNLQARSTPGIAEQGIRWVKAADPGQLGLPRPVENLLRNINAI